MSQRTFSFGLIGHGRIGRCVLQAWRQGELAGWAPTAVLVRRRPDGADPLLTTDLQVFLAAAPDVVIEAAGPDALAAYGEEVLGIAPLWTVSAAALADAALHARLEQAVRASGHRLRVLVGAIAGLDGVAVAATDPQCRLHLDIELPPDGQPAGVVFDGDVREAARRFPHSVNVAAAAALAGPGLDATTIRVSRPGPVAAHRLALKASSRYGALSAETQPRLAEGLHPVAASIVAALRQQRQPIWVG
ncbi:MAG: DUF108 domain-containing protein [Comamonadaceae bacterium]|nr:MAG: DUF108 domain-containing protein [Comamonadaceae bacterium]